MLKFRFCISLHGAVAFAPALQVSAADSKSVAPQTVYTVRISTGNARGSAMSEWRAGVWLCLVNKDGAAFLHRATPLSDPEVIEHELIQICQVRTSITCSLQRFCLCNASSQLIWGCQSSHASVHTSAHFSVHLTKDQQALQADVLPSAGL